MAVRGVLPRGQAKAPTDPVGQLLPAASRGATKTSLSARQNVCPSGPPTRSPQGSAGQDCPGHPAPDTLVSSRPPTPRCLCLAASIS